MAGAKNLTCRWVGDYFLVVQTGVNPSQAEWDWEMREVSEGRSRIQGTLVYTMGGSPNAAQRKQLREVVLHGGAAFPTAIMMSSTVIRTVVTAINFFLNDQLKTFSLHDVDSAMSYIGVPLTQCRSVIAALGEMKRE